VSVHHTKLTPRACDTCRSTCNPWQLLHQRPDHGRANQRHLWIPTWPPAGTVAGPRLAIAESSRESRHPVPLICRRAT